MRILSLSVCLFFLFVGTADAQRIDRNHLAETVGRYVDSVGPMSGSPLKYIVEAFQSRKYDQVEMSYAIYTWIAQNVVFDTRAYHHPNSANNSPSSALNRREAGSLGFANLFKSMCDLARIECVVIEGNAKTHAAAIGDLKKSMTHAWNGVRIKNTWYYVDAAFGAGFTDRKVRYFTKEYTDVWFFTNRELFLTSHFPKNKQWQFTNEPVNKSFFNQAPIVGVTAIRNEIFFQEGTKGRLRGKVNDCKRVVFDLAKPEEVTRVGVEIKDKNTHADYYVEHNKLFVDIPFPQTGKYPVTVTVNGKPAYSFKAEVIKKPKR